ncbi:MAG: DoxX family protein [Sphingomonas sp.]
MEQITGSRWFLVIARLALVAPFLMSGIAKLIDPTGATAEMQQFGLTPAGLFAGIVIAVQLAGGVAVLVGRCTAAAAGGLALFTLAATLLAHPFWSFADPMLWTLHRNIFVEHVSIIGGLMLAASLGVRRA